MKGIINILDCKTFEELEKLLVTIWIIITLITINEILSVGHQKKYIALIKNKNKKDGHALQARPSILNILFI